MWWNVKSFFTLDDEDPLSLFESVVNSLFEVFAAFFKGLYPSLKSLKTIGNLRKCQFHVGYLPLDRDILFPVVWKAQIKTVIKCDCFGRRSAFA
jgi:hypothetical protein